MKNNSKIMQEYKVYFEEFIEATNNVSKTQEEILLSVIEKNKDCIFGKKHNFKRIKSISEFRNNVQISEWKDYTTYIEKIKKGEKNILTNDEVIILEPTSGTTLANKLIPYTKTLQKDFENAIAPWIYDIYSNRSNLADTSSYWSISPSVPKKAEESIIPIGFSDDSEYLSIDSKKEISKTFTVPPTVRLIQNFESFRYVSLLFLIKNGNLGLISVWNPSYLVILFKQLHTLLPDIIEDIKKGKISSKISLPSNIREKLEKELIPSNKRAKELQEISKNPKDILTRIFPKLGLISCWTDGLAGEEIKNIKKLFTNVEIQGKGLISTEAFISFPLTGEEGCVLAVRSHFFEFQSVRTSELLLINELKKNETYFPVVTTNGGLYRYKINDIIKVVGFRNQCPLIKFISKTDNISDLRGEKISEQQINEIKKKLNLNEQFFMISPETNADSCHYTIFVETYKKQDELKKYRSKFEKLLRENFHYDYCRKIGQLKKLKLFQIEKDGAESYMKHISSIQKLGDIKPKLLTHHQNLAKIFKGEYIDDE